VLLWPNDLPSSIVGRRHVPPGSEPNCEWASAKSSHRLKSIARAGTVTNAAYLQFYIDSSSSHSPRNRANEREYNGSCFGAARPSQATMSRLQTRWDADNDDDGD
jgi:hypothetical protein